MLNSVLLMLSFVSAQAGYCLATDVFCVELNRARFLEAGWQNLDRHLASLPESCSNDFPNALRRARIAANEKFLAFAEYYRKWSGFAHDQSQLIGTMNLRHRGSQQEVELLLAQAEREFAELNARRRALETSTQIVSTADEVGKLDGLISLSAQRLENFRKTRAKWQEAETSNEAGKKAAADLARQTLEMRRLSESERILWDSYYEGKELRLQLMCHEQHR